MKLDLLDKKILHELSKNARQSSSQIAKQVKTSQQVVSYRIKQLVKKEIISEFLTTIHFSAFGYANYIVMIKLTQQTAKQKKELITTLEQRSRTLLVSECGGQWDLIVNSIAKSPVLFEQELSAIISKHAQAISHYDTALTLGGSSFGRTYLHKETNRNTKFGEEQHISIDETDKTILKHIAKNARASALEMEQQTVIGYKTIINRIKTLQQQGIITGFRPFINIAAIGYSASKIYLDINHLTQEDEKQFNAYLSSKKYAIGTMRMIGKYNYEVTIETKEQTDTWAYYKDIQDYLGGKVRAIELVPIFKKHKYNYFPDVLMEN